MLNPSLSEVRYTCLGVEQDLRSDGRGRLDYRCIEVESGVLEQSNGSARIAFGAGGTAVLASVKVEVAEPAPERPGQGFLHVNVECNPSVSPKFERRAASNLNAELTQTLDTLLARSGFLEHNSGLLSIVAGAACWSIYVDVTVMDYDGNLTDAVALAAYASLRDARVPSLTLVDTEGGGKDYELDADAAAGRALCMDKVPLCVTLSRIGDDEKLFVADASFDEDFCALSRVAVAVDRLGGVCGVTKLGAGGIDVAVMQKMLQTASHLGSQLFLTVDAVLVRVGAESDAGS